MPANKAQTTNEIILETSLQAFFYDQLVEINQKSSRPLPTETIFYSSLVMDHFGDSGRYFEIEDGRVRDKVLGLKLLESSNRSKTEQKRILKDVGDTALLVCGYFSDSVNQKIVDLSYYQELGQMAYRRLNSFIPEFYNYPEFFTVMSDKFHAMTNLMTLISKQNLEQSKMESVFLISDKKIA